MPTTTPFRHLDALRERLLERVCYASDAWERRCRDVFRPTIDQMPFVQDVAAHVLRVDGRTAAGHHLEHSAADRRLLDAHARSWLSIFQIEAISSHGYTLTDLLTHRRLDALSRVATLDDVGDCLLARVVPLDDAHLIPPAHPYVLPLERTTRVLEHLRRRFGDGPVDEATLRTEPAAIALIRRWEDELHIAPPGPATREKFTFLEEDRPHLEATLTALPGSSGPTPAPHDHHDYTIASPAAPLGTLTIGPHTIELSATTRAHAHLLATMLLAAAPELRPLR